MATRIVFAGGGSGGHVFPGIAIIERLISKRPGLEVSWIGSGAKMERQILKRFDIDYHAIPSGKLRRYFSFRNFLDFFKTLAGIAASLLLLRALRPALLFSKGGYVSVPPVLAARILHIPVFAHDSDVDPGLATRINSHFAERIFVAYEESRAFFPASRQSAIVVSGNPIRAEITRGNAERGRKFVGASNGKPMLLVLGGSLGARQVNELIRESSSSLRRYYHIAHQTGAEDAVSPTGQDHFVVDFFGSEYPDVLAAADLVVARAGGGTVWEIAAQGKPAILIPLDTSSSRGDQLKNARRLEKYGAAIVLEGDDATAASLSAHARRLAENPDERDRMGVAAHRLASVDAAECIAAAIAQRVGEIDGHCSP